MKDFTESTSLLNRTKIVFRVAIFLHKTQVEGSSLKKINIHVVTSLKPEVKSSLKSNIELFIIVKACWL